MTAPAVRLARPDDHSAIAAFTQDTFDWGDYVADAFPRWLADENSAVLVAVDDAFEGDTDALVALVSVLVTAGVQHIETAHVRAVARIFDTHLAISAGQIEVLES